MPSANFWTWRPTTVRLSPAAPGAPARPLKAPVHHDLSRPPQVRETITLANRPGVHTPERKPVTPAPKLLVPKPAVIAGPTIIREEKPDHVPAPRPRLPLGPLLGHPPASPHVDRRVRATWQPGHGQPGRPIEALAILLCY